MMEGEAPEERAREIGVRFGQELVSADASRENVAKSLVSILDTLGFEPMLISQREEQIEIQTGNCIFKELVALNPSIICLFHHSITEGIASQLAGGTPHVSNGSYRCRQVVRLKDTADSVGQRVV
jgi:predicted ArsR family transcriptional regulator